MKNYFSKEKLTKTGITAILITVTVFPVLFLFGKALFLLATQENFIIPGINISLFGRSVGINIISTLMCSIMGLASACFIWTFFGKYRMKAFFATVFFALIPPFIHVHSWIKAIDFINGIIYESTGFIFDFTGVSAVVITTSFSYLPYTMALCLFGLLSIPDEVLESVKTENFSRKIYTKIILPYVSAYIYLGALFVFLININEYAIPSVFGVNVYALELFALYSASGNMYATALSSWPLIVISAILLVLIALKTRKTDLSENFAQNENPFSDESVMGIVSLTGGILLFLFAAIPLISMIVESFTVVDLGQIIVSSSEQFIYTFVISGITAGLVVFIASIYSYLKFYNHKNKLPVILFVIPFVLPSSILGLSIISFFNRGILRSLYTSPFMPVAGLFARFFVLAILYFSIRFIRIDKSLSDTLKLNHSFTGGYFRVVLPLLKTDMVTCFLLIFSLSVSEYGIVHLITPPGYQMLTIKIYNYLHYGSSEVVFALNLAVLIIVLLSASVVALLFRTRRKVM